MNWPLDQVNAAIIAGGVSLSISLIVALLAIKRAMNLNPEFAPESVAHEILMERKCPYRTFRVLKYHLGGFTDDELRKILVRAGGIRLMAGGQEVWGLLSRNRKFLAIDEIKDDPTTEIELGRSGHQQNPQRPDVSLQDEAHLARDASEPFERLRAEMIKLGALECVRSPARQE
jgi:hypothetical protein